MIFDENNFKIMAEQRNPKILLKRLENRCGHKVGIDYHMLRGMKNPSRFCYVISLLQLCFHCDDFVQFIKSNDPENDTETLLKNMCTYLYSSNSNSADISDFLFGWKGWGEEQSYFPNGFQDVLDFFLYFFDTFSDKMKKLFQFKATEKNEVVLNFAHLRVPITSNSLRKCIQNETNLNTTPVVYPKNLFIQLDRAQETDTLNDTYVITNRTIVFGEKLYSFKGAIVYINNNHYHSIIKIEDEFFDFDDQNVSPLFLDNYSVTPSSYNRCLECEKKLHRNAVLFLYEQTDYDDSSDIHLSPKMKKIMDCNEPTQQILNFHSVEDNENPLFIEVPHNELARKVINLNQVSGTDLKGTIKINTNGIPEKVIEPIADNRYKNIRKIFKMVAKVLRNLKEYDTGKLNSMLLKTKLEIFEKEEMDFVCSQGFLLFDIIKNDLLENEDLNFNDVQKALKVIIDSYEAKYSAILQNIKKEEPIFNNQNEEEEEEDCEKNDIKVTNTNEIISSLINAAENINSDDDIDWTDCSDYEDYSSEYDYDYDDHNSFELKDPEIIKKWCLYNNDKDFLVDLNNCPKVAPLCIDTTDIEDDIPDDNQFFLRDYDWKSRVEILDARTILGEIRNKMYPKNINKTSLQLKSDIREAIRYEVLRDRFTVEANKKKSIKEFANDWINHNIKCDQKNALVIAYNKIIQEEQKKRKNMQKKGKKKQNLLMKLNNTL